MYLQGIIQIMEEMAIAMETAVFSAHLQVASAAVLCNLIPVDELADLVRIMISDQLIIKSSRCCGTAISAPMRRGRGRT